MLRIKHTLFIIFGLTSFIIFYIGFLNYLKSDDHIAGSLILVFAAIVSSGSLAGTMFIAKSITNPLEKLTKTMNDFSKTNKIKSNSQINTSIKEIDELNKNFHYMAQTIQKTIEMEMEYIEKLKEIDRKKDEFTSMISHELKTPLVPILGYVKMLQKPDVVGNLNDKQLHAVNEINLSSLKLQKLIGDILTAQKLEMGKFIINNQDIHVSELLEETFNIFKPLTMEKNIQIIKHDCPDIVCNSDKDRIIQIFSNLIKNAIDFVEPGSGKIEIGAKTFDNYVMFFVKDNGIGIPLKSQKDIFKKFYQIDTSNRRKRDGSGLGLAICKGITERLKGRIWLESKMGRGTTFYFTVPQSHSKLKLADLSH